MELQPHRDSLYNFVITMFDMYDYERSQMNNGFVSQFKSYDNFCRHQRDVIDNVDLATLSFLQQFQSLLQLNNIELVDKESMVSMTGDGFVFVDNKIVFTNSR